jgi:hypothetical protein
MNQTGAMLKQNKKGQIGEVDMYMPVDGTRSRKQKRRVAFT